MSGGGGGKGRAPAAPTPPDNTAADKAAAEKLAEEMRKRAGRSANIGTSAIGLLAQTTNTSGNTTLGS